MTATVAIDRADDPRLADYLELNDPSARAAREGDRFFVAEGPTAVERLVGSGHRIRSILVTDRRLDRMRPVIELAGAPVYVTTREVLREVCGFDLHRGVVAAADRRPLPTVRELAEDARHLVVLEGLNDPENLGAIARSARAFGIDGAVLDPTCIDPYYRRTVRVSMGEVLYLAVARARSWPEDLDVLHEAGFETWAMTPAPDAHELWDDHLWATDRGPRRLAFVLGAEGPGLSDRTMARCTRRVRIPIAGGVDSLNVGSAAAVTFAEARRRRAPFTD